MRKDKTTPRVQNKSTRDSPSRHGRLRLIADHRLWVSIADVARIFGVTRQTIYKWMDRKEHPFPRPMQLGPRISRLSVDIVVGWLEDAPQLGSLAEVLAVEGDRA